MKNSLDQIRVIIAKLVVCAQQKRMKHQNQTLWVDALEGTNLVFHGYKVVQLFLSSDTLMINALIPWLHCDQQTIVSMIECGT